MSHELNCQLKTLQKGLRSGNSEIPLVAISSLCSGVLYEIVCDRIHCMATLDYTKSLDGCLPTFNYLDMLSLTFTPRMRSSLRAMISDQEPFYEVFLSKKI